MKILLLGIILLAACTEIHSNRTRLSSRARQRFTTTEPSQDLRTLDTTALSDTIGRTTIETLINAMREKKWNELSKTDCGILKNNSTIPWIAVLEHTDPSGRDKRKTLSKGVLISDQHVLTTVSSIYNSHPFWEVSSVRLGHITTWITETSQRRDNSFTRAEIDQIYQHESKDIAIIKLANKVQFSESIQPICLPIDDNYNFPQIFFHMCKRSNEENRKFHVRLVSSIPLTPQDCETLFHRKGAEFSTTEFCSWDEYGDSCIGDVGGPLMAHFNNRFLVIGLNSYVFTPKEFDASDYPGVYVKVGSFLKWIDRVSSLK